MRSIDGHASPSSSICPWTSVSRGLEASEHTRRTQGSVAQGPQDSCPRRIGGHVDSAKVYPDATFNSAPATATAIAREVKHSLELEISQLPWVIRPWRFFSECPLVPLAGSFHAGSLRTQSGTHRLTSHDRQLATHDATSGWSPYKLSAWV